MRNTLPAISLFLLATVNTIAYGADNLAANYNSVNTATSNDSNVVWAVNIGGAEHRDINGVLFEADQLNLTTEQGTIDRIIGSQDNTVFRTYRSGELHIQRPLDNGSYDISFNFAEPKDTPIGSRVFDVLAEGQVVINDMDVRQARDGNYATSLTRTVVDVNVEDGVLDITFNASQGQPLLNALVVTRKNNTKDVANSTDWKLIWSDEFDYEGKPDPSKWSYNIWSAKKVNDEDQTYTDRLKNVRVTNGVLTIEAHKENYNGADYTSGRIHSSGKGDFLYGRAEIRAKLPAGQGTWPAIWMMPSDIYRYADVCEEGELKTRKRCSGWPNSGEIDIMEHVGYDMNRVHGTVHTKAYYWVNGKQRKASVEAHGVDQQFQIYALEWSPERIDVFYNDTLYFSYHNQGEGWQAWPFDHPYHIILNIAVGGGWGGAGGPTDITKFPAKMEVDYVRIYQQSSQ